MSELSSYLGPKLEWLKRRACIRYPAHLESSCQRPSAGLAEPRWPCKIRDISTGGIGLVVNQAFDRGTILEIELQNAGRTFSRAILARVIHATEVLNGTWLLGCLFVKDLPEEELRALMAGPVPRSSQRAAAESGARAQGPGVGAASNR